MVKVTFYYDEETRTWEPVVTGVVDETEARQAFNAVILTMDTLDHDLLEHHKVVPVSEGYSIHPAVSNLKRTDIEGNKL